MFLRETSRLPFIESDGNSYIEIPIYPNLTLISKIFFSFSPDVSILSAERQYIMGTYAQNSSGVVDRYQFVYGGSGFTVSGSVYTGMCGYGNGARGVGWNTFTPTYAGSNYMFELNIDAVGEFEVSSGGYSEILYQAPSSAFSGSQNNIYLFACNENGTVGHFSNGVRIHRAEFYELAGSSMLPIGCFVPCLENGKIGMKDIFAYGTPFYENKGSGTFKIGK